MSLLKEEKSEGNDCVLIIVKNDQDSVNDAYLSDSNDNSNLTKLDTLVINKLKAEIVDSDYAEIEVIDEDLLSNEFRGDDGRNIITRQRKNKNKISLVEELRNTYPELRENEERLVEKLCEMMRSCKPEDPPVNFVIDSINFECSYCHSKSKSYNAAKRHYQWRHGPRFLICYACGVDFRSNTNLCKHEKKCYNKDAHIVLKARAIVVGGKGRNRPFLDTLLTKKMKKAQDKLKGKMYNVYKCPKCPATYKLKDRLWAHLNLHEGLRPHQCNLCPAAYTSSCSLLRHIKSHSESKYICDVCGIKCNSRSSIVNHMKTHIPGNGYACTIPGCDRRYSLKSYLKIHIDVDHLNKPLPFRCEICQLRFRRMYRLQTHMRNHHGLEIMTQNRLLKKLPLMSDPEEIKPTAALLAHSNVLLCCPDSDVKTSIRQKERQQQRKL